MSRKRKSHGGNTAVAESRVRVLRDEVDHNKLRLEELRQRAVLGAMISTKLTKVASAMESRLSEAGVKSFESGLDMLDSIVDPRDYLGDGMPYRGIYTNSMPSAIWHKEEGRFFPIFITEIELRSIRGMGTVMGFWHPMGVSILDNLCNYTIGKGFDVTVVADKEVADRTDVQEIVGKARRVLTQFWEDNDIKGDADREVFIRSHREGDGGVTLWDEHNGRVALRFAEPDQITQPGPEQAIVRWLCEHGNAEWVPGSHLPFGGETPETTMLFGIHSDVGDVSSTHGYYCQWTSSGDDWDYMPGGKYPWIVKPNADRWLEFYKSNTDRQIKRGITDFFSVEIVMRLAAKVLRNTGEGAALQAAIAFVRQHAPGVTQGQIDTFQFGGATDQVNLNTPLGSQSRWAQRYDPGTVLDLSAGLEYKAGPMGDSQRAKSYIEVADSLARMAAVRWHAPEWMMDGSAEHTNKATAFVAESPFIKKQEVEQEKEVAFWTRISWKVLEFAHGAGCFGGMPFGEIKRTIHLEIKGAQISVREPEKDTARRQILCAQGILSKKTWAQEEGYDLDQEVQNGAKVEAPEQEAGPPMPKGINYGRGESQGWEGGHGSGPAMGNQNAYKGGPTRQQFSDRWSNRLHGKLDALMDVGKTQDEHGVWSSVPYKAKLQKVSAELFDLDPSDKEHQMAIGLGKSLGESPFEFTFENIRTGYGAEKNAYGVTGTGNAKEVFRNASGLLVGALDRYRPACVYYTSEESSRSRLYEYMTSKISLEQPSYTGIKATFKGDSRTFFAVLKNNSSDKAISAMSKMGADISVLSKSKITESRGSDDHADRAKRAAAILWGNY